METLNSNQRKLLDALTKDEKAIEKKLYSAGSYWDYKTKKILYWLKKKGLKNFRGFNSGVGTSYSDNITMDIRNELGFKGRLLSSLTYLPLLKNIYNGQVKLNSSHIEKYLKKNQSYYENTEKVKYLISKYKIEQTTEFGCKLKFNLNNKEFSCHYLNICDRVENIGKFINFKEISSYFEIGGGFGANIHFLINNFENIKKIIYLDIVPNLFVGTEYLRYFFGNAVKDYCLLKNEKEIKFSKNNDLEILCIPPWKIKNISSTIDHFHNSASFQEMPREVVKNYSNYILNLLNKNGSISLIIYSGWEKNNTLNPDQIKEVFKKKLLMESFPNLDDNEKKLFYLIHK